MHLYTILIRAAFAVLIGALIGSERARHGRAAGMRTHIIVCLGSCMTSMTSMFVAFQLGSGGDVFKIPAQVVSGIGFLGAGMIILKNNNVISGLTTAAGVWATGTIGIAVGYGFYYGAAIVTVLFLGTIILFAKFEKRKKSTEIIYLEIDDPYSVNRIIKALQTEISEDFTYQVLPAKSENRGNVGISIVIDRSVDMDISSLCELENVVYAVEE